MGGFQLITLFLLASFIFLFAGCCCCCVKTSGWPCLAAFVAISIIAFPISIWGLVSSRTQVTRLTDLANTDSLMDQNEELQILIPCFDAMTVESFSVTQLNMQMIDYWLKNFVGITYVNSAQMIITVLMYLTIGVH